MPSYKEQELVEDKKIWPLHWLPDEDKRVTWFVYPDTKEGQEMKRKSIDDFNYVSSMKNGFRSRSTSVLKELEFLGERPEPEKYISSDEKDDVSISPKKRKRDYTCCIFDCLGLC